MNASCQPKFSCPYPGNEDKEAVNQALVVNIVKQENKEY